MSIPRGTRIGTYDVVEQVDKGGMGVVYRARDTRLDRDVALKMLPPSLDRSATVLADFEREAKLLAALNHPHIATIHGLETTDTGDRCIVLEFVEGESLARRLARGPLPLAEAIGIMRQVADGLSAAHEHGVIHRDLKPGNVMVTPSGWVKLLDFGLAKRTEPDERAAALDATIDIARTVATSDDMVVGTPGYMSPEQVRALPQDQRSDIFSFGCVLYEVVTGRRAFRGDTLLEMCAQVLHVEPDWTALPKDLSARVRILLMSCLTKDPADRPPSMAYVRDAMADDATAVQARARASEPVATPNNLPRAVTSFVARETEIAECRRLFAHARLLTLTGVGGCGKTRLAVRIAEDLLHESPDGVWFVDLAPLDDAERVPVVIAAALGVREEQARPLVDTIIEHVGEKQMVLCLDNCEHLLAQCAEFVERALRECSALRVLATSREALAIVGEQTYSVPSLAVPSRDAPLTRDAIAASGAMRLFAERAALVRPGFTLTETDAPAVAEICRRLDGIPLAIELAAARAKMLTPEQIHTKLADRFRLLTGGSKTTLPRHQTLRATIQWSYDLLAPAERDLLRVLSVFAGGWTLEAATAVSADDADEFDVLDLTTRLLDKSLITAQHTPGSDSRYRMLETVRQYAQERALEAGETAALRTRHLAHFLAMAEGAYWKLWSDEQALWVRRLQLEHENLLDALAWCDSVDDGADKGLRLASSLRVFWDIRGHVAIGRRELHAALTRAGAETPSLARGRALYGAGWLAVRQAEFDAARTLFEDALRVFQDVGDKRGVSAAWSGLATVARSVGERPEDFGEARTHYERALSISREINDTPSIAASLNNLGDVALRQGDYASARLLFEEAAKTYEGVGDREYRSTALHNLADACIKLGDAAAARAALATCFDLASEVAGQSSLANALDSAARLALADRDAKRAAWLLAAADAHRKATGSVQTQSEAAEHEADVAAARSAAGDEGFVEAWESGWAAPVADAVEHVRRWLKSPSA